MVKIQFQKVCDTKGLGVNALRHKRTHVVVGIWMLEIAWLRRFWALRGNVKLQDHLLLLTWCGQEKGFFPMGALLIVLIIALVDLDSGHLTDFERAWVTTLTVVYVDHQVSCLACKEEIL